MSDTIPVTVRIMEKEFRVVCPEAERDSLLESARYLDIKMREIRDSRKVVGMDRIAVICALNLAHELLHGGAPPSNHDTLAPRVQNLNDKIAIALQQTK